MPDIARFFVNSGTVTAQRFVKVIDVSPGTYTVEQAGLGEAAFGLPSQNGDASLGEAVLVDQTLVTSVESGAALVTGVQLMSDADGRAVEWDADPSHVIVGTATSDSTAAGDSVAIDVSSSGWSQSFESAPYAVEFHASNDLTHVTGATLADQVLPLSIGGGLVPVGTWLADPADSTQVRFPTTGLYAFTVETFNAGNDNSLGVNVLAPATGGAPVLAHAYAPPTMTGSDGVTVSSGGWMPVTDLDNDTIQLRATYPDSTPSTYNGSPVFLRIWRVGDLPT